MARRRPRTVPGGLLLRRLRDELARGWPPGVTVLTGDDLYHLDRAQRLLVEGLSEARSSEFGLTVFGEEKVDVATVVAAARSVGMFAARRVVLVREVTALHGEVAALAEYGAHAPPGSYLLVRAPALDQRRKLHKILADCGKLLRFESAAPEDTGQLTADVNALAAEAELELDTAASAFLAQVCGGDLYRVESELAKLAAWLAGRSRRVELEAVQQITAGSGLLSGWAAADAILLRDRSAALAAVRRLIEAGDEPLRIVGGLAFRARSMLTAKAMLEAGAGFGQVIQAARAWAYREKLERGLARYSLDELLGFPALLLEADRSLKSRSLDPCAVLESLVERMVGSAEQGRS